MEKRVQEGVNSWPSTWKLDGSFFTFIFCKVVLALDKKRLTVASQLKTITSNYTEKFITTEAAAFISLGSLGNYERIF